MTLKKEICKAFDDHASDYEKVALVQQEIGSRLFERLDYLAQKPMMVLDLGCGPGNFLYSLKKRYPKAQVLGFDLSLAMLKQAKNKARWWNKSILIQGDMEYLPFASASFDLIFANQVVHWASSLPQVLHEMHRVMKPQGCLMFSSLGPDTFSELRKTWSRIDTHAHTNDFMDMHDLGDCLMQAKFLDPVVDMEFITMHYPSMSQLLDALKKQGVRNIHKKRNSGLTGKMARVHFEEAFSDLCTPQGKYPLTYEVVYAHAWKGEITSVEKDHEIRVSIDDMLRTYRSRAGEG